MGKFQNELEELQAKGVITEEVAAKIRAHYATEAGSGMSRMVIAFGILGALLVGLGIVLIIAHNWDDFPNAVKLTFAFTPLLVSHGICGYILFKDIESKAWREGVSVFLMASVAASISIVSQVYNIHGDLGGFLMVWGMLSLPVCYVMRSSVASLMTWVIITSFVVTVGYDFVGRPPEREYYYWLMALLLAPWYYLQLKRSPESNFTYFHHWVIVICLTVALGTLSHRSVQLLFADYVTLFSVFVLIGQLPYFNDKKLLSNAYLVGGSAGTMILLLTLTFEWPDVASRSSQWWLSGELFVWVFLFIAASYLLFTLRQKIGLKNVLTKSYVFIIYVVFFIIGLSSTAAAGLLTNILVLALGVLTVREGAQTDKLWRMNYGLLIISTLIFCRFVDTDLSFIFRGLLFIGVGIGFFVVNYRMMKKRKNAVNA